MLMIIEILLTISVWKKGWKGWALVPGIAAILFGAVLGAAYGPGITSRSDLFVLGLLFDGLTIAALLVMRANPPKKDVDEKGAAVEVLESTPVEA